MAEPTEESEALASTEKHDGEEAPSATPAREDGQDEQLKTSQPEEAEEGARQNNRDDETPTPPQVAAPTTDLCGVCQTNPHKYKCPRCRLPYCSVACNKVHRENHPPDPEPQPQPGKQDLPDAPSNNALVQLVDPTSPFRVLETSDRLKLLFNKYPNLPNQLLEIHAATQPPPSDGPEKAIPAALMQGLKKKDTWNHDIGIKNGKAALRKARKANGEDGEAIREYTELISHIMSEASRKANAAAAAADIYLQQQVAEEDTKLIERLLAEEQRKK